MRSINVAEVSLAGASLLCAGAGADEAVSKVFFYNLYPFYRYL
jgi:hypothetical protein